MKKTIFKGCGTALVTPFDENGINYDSFSRLIDFQLEKNIDALIICGTTGEPSTMSLQEKKDVIKFVINYVNKKVPVIVGTGGNCTKDVLNLSKYAEDSGADACLIVTPYYNKTTQSRIN